MCGGKVPERIISTENFNDIKNYLISFFQEKHRLTRDSSVLITELGIPVKSNNGEFIEVLEQQDQVNFKTKSGSIHYHIIKS